MVEVVCAACGVTFEAQRRSAVYCGATCRQRGNRAGGTVLVLGAKSAPAGPRSEPAAGVAAATRSALTEAGRLDTVLGQAALTLAARLDLGSADTGSAMASLSKELRAVLAEALAGVKLKASALDELRVRRDRKRGA